MSLTDKNFVTRGSEEFLGLDEALYRAVKDGSQGLINYFLRISPQVKRGCESKHIRLLVMASLLEGRYDMVKKIWSECDFPKKSQVLAMLTPKPGYPVDTKRLFQILRGNFRLMDAVNLYDSRSFFERTIDVISPEVALVLAATKGYLDMVENIIKFNPDLDAELALDNAGREGHLDVIKYLLKIDPNLYLQDAIDDAAGEGHLNVVKYFIGIDPDSDLPLESAAGEGHLDVIKYFLEINPNSDLPLESAAEGGHLDVIKYFLEINPNLRLCGALGNAAGEGHLNVIKYLMEIDPNLNPEDVALQSAAGGGHLDIIKYFLEIDPNLDLQYALGYAASGEQLDVIKYQTRAPKRRRLMN